MNAVDFHRTKFLLSAAQSKQFPDDRGSEAAFIGRSNSGKSSSLNVLTQCKNLARVSKTPGRTQLINFFVIDDQRRLVDLPGYGYAKVSKSIREKWTELIDSYLGKRKSLKVLILLMDIRHPMKAVDQAVLSWSQDAHLPVHILLTKSDKLSRSQALAVLKNTKEQLKHFTNEVSIQLFSATKLIGKEEMEQVLMQYLL